jgi:integrase/recombinase XerC/integrase/recombinase XerD
MQLLLKAFFAWLHREDYTETNRLEGLHNFKAPQKVVEVLSEEEISWVAAAIDTKTPSGCQDFAILVLMLDSGLRLGEIISLLEEDLDIDAGHLKVMGKASKERRVPFGASTPKALWRYRNHYRPEWAYPRVGNFFLTQEGEAMPESGMKSMFKRLSRRSGVTRLHPHLCRNTFATRHLMNGGDVFSLQQILRHTTLEMVRRYASLASAHVAVQHRKFSPMDRIRLATFGGRRNREFARSKWAAGTR